MEMDSAGAYYLSRRFGAPRRGQAVEARFPQRQRKL